MTDRIEVGTYAAGKEHVLFWYKFPANLPDEDTIAISMATENAIRALGFVQNESQTGWVRE